MSIKKTRIFFYKLPVFLAVLAVLSLSAGLTAKSEIGDENINVISESSGRRIAPGDFLPISVKLVNFGLEKRVDVVVSYKIFNNADKDVYQQKEVYSESETVAVETTASFVKRIQIPYSLDQGLYKLVTVVNYPYQQEPAISKMPFLVEEKIGGFFKSDLKIYSIFFALAMAVATLIAVLITYVSIRRKKSQGVTYDYSKKPKDQIVYYEILSNIIFQMRLRIGDKAIKIANEIPELDVSEKTGEVVNIKNNPAKIISTLLARYESILGQPLSFGILRR